MKILTLILIAVIAGVLVGLPLVAEAQEDTVMQGDVAIEVMEVDKEVLNSIILICEDARRHVLHNLFLICEERP